MSFLPFILPCTDCSTEQFTVLHGNTSVRRVREPRAMVVIGAIAAVLITLETERQPLVFFALAWSANRQHIVCSFSAPDS